MELHKPQGFSRGGPAVNFQQLAMNNQSKQNDQGIMSVITNPVSGVQEDVNIVEPEMEETKQTNFQAQPQPNVIVETQSAEQQPALQAKQKDRESALFTDAEKKGIFAAQLALALSQPGDPFANFAGGLGRGAMSLADLKAIEAELEQKENKFSDSEAVIDKKTGERAFATEKQKQTEFLEDGSPRFVPIEKSDGADKVRMDVATLQTDGSYKADNILRSDYDASIHEPFTGYVVAKLKGQDARNRILNNELAADQLKPKNEQKYELPDKEAEAIKNYIARTEAGKLIEAKDAVKKQLKKLRRVSQLGKRAYAFVEAGARGGFAGGLTQGYTNLAAAIQQSVRRSPDQGGFGFSAQDKADYERVQSVLDPDRKYTKDAMYTDVKNQTINIAALSKRFAKLDAGLQSVIIELAYAKAKAREEGGRFSVSDIQAALDSIGDNSSPDIMKTKIAETVFNDLQGGLNNWTYGDLPDEFEDIVRDRDFFSQRTSLETNIPGKGVNTPTGNITAPLTDEQLKKIFNDPNKADEIIKQLNNQI